VFIKTGISGQFYRQFRAHQSPGATTINLSSDSWSLTLSRPCGAWLLK